MSNFAIIVLNYNDHNNTIKFVKNIRDYNIVNKIIIVDNKSTIENEIKLLKEVESEKVDIISSDKNGGYAYGNNIGLEYLEKIGSYEYVAISNPDVYVDENTINACINYLASHNKTAIVAPRMNFVTGEARRSAWKKRKPIIDIANSTRLTELLMYPIFKSGEYTKKDYMKDDLKVDCIAGSFFIAKYDSLKKVGFFDPHTFLFYEEDILSEKMKRAGLEIHLLNNYSFMHYESQTIGKAMNVFKKQDILFDSRIYFQRKYNKIGIITLVIFYILKYFRKI